MYFLVVMNKKQSKTFSFITEDANAMLAKYPGAPLFILGDFNSCRLDCVLPSLQQYVDIPTRRGNILDLCYGNITDAFRARSYPPLGLADHNFICLLPLYKQEQNAINHSATAPPNGRRTPLPSYKAPWPAPSGTFLMGI